MGNPFTALTRDDLARRTSLKWRRYPEDVLPLWVAEMDVVLADPVRRVLTETAESGDTGYPAAEEYAEALAPFALRHWDWDVDPVRVRAVPDVMRGIAEVLRLVTGPGDPVVINPPVYPPFYAFVGLADRRVVEAPLGPDHRLDLALLEDTFAHLTREGGRAAYLLCNPHNPTGTVHTREELATVAALAERYGVRVVADEIHAPLVHAPARHTPYLAVPGSGRGFALLSASKAFNLPGIKAAAAVAGADAVDDLARIPEEVVMGVTHLGVRTHTAALREGDGYLRGLLAGLDANRRRLDRLLAEKLPGVRHRAPAATCLAWLDCRELDLGDPAAHFLEHARVALVPGPDFGAGGEGHVRLNFGTAPEVLEEAVDRMAAAV